MELKDKVQLLIEEIFSINQLAKFCNCHSSTIGSWLRGKPISEKSEKLIERGLQDLVKRIEEIIQ